MEHHFQEWVPSPKDIDRFNKWRALAEIAHDEFEFLIGQNVPDIVVLEKPMQEWIVAIVSTAGIHLADQEPFDTLSSKGDWSFREIPDDVSSKNLVVSHTHFNHASADQDINCLFPIDRLREFAEDGVIKDVSPTNYGLMGFIPNPKPLINLTVPVICDRLKEMEVDAVIMTPG